jgi:hypothetical protein
MAADTIIVEKKKNISLEILCECITNHSLTEGELGIVRIIVWKEIRNISNIDRKKLAKVASLSVANLNNNLIRLKLKGIFDRNWEVHPALQKYSPQLQKIVIKLT